MERTQKRLVNSFMKLVNEVITEWPPLNLQRQKLIDTELFSSDLEMINTVFLLKILMASKILEDKHYPLRQKYIVGIAWSEKRLHVISTLTRVQQLPHSSLILCYRLVHAQIGIVPILTLQNLGLWNPSGKSKSEYAFHDRIWNKI